MCFFRLQSNLVYLYMLMCGELRFMTMAISSCNKGAIAHLAADMLHTRVCGHFGDFDVNAFLTRREPTHGRTRRSVAAQVDQRQYKTIRGSGRRFRAAQGGSYAIHPTSPIGHSYQAASLLSSYLYITSIDLLQWRPVARRLVLRGPLVYLELSLPRRLHIYVDALAHCNISRRIRIRGVIALRNG